MKEMTKPNEEQPRRPSLAPLQRWPNACLPDRACKIDGILYPAPNSLGRDDLPMWLDYVQLRLTSAQSLFFNLVAGLIGAMFGGVGVWAGTAATGNPWGALAAMLLVILAVVLVGRTTLGQSDHRALEQRWLLYRERGRQLGID